MSLGLGHYGSDSSSAESDAGDTDQLTAPSTNTEEVKLDQVTSNFFGGEYDDSDSSSSHEEEEEEEDNSSSEVLPLPELSTTHAGQPSDSSSVFSNSYKKAEEARLAVLKRHVNLSPAELPADSNKAKRPRFTRPRKPQRNLPDPNELFDERDSSRSHSSEHTKPRMGPPTGLQPNKRFMQSYRKIQEAERPWTIQK